MKAEREELLAAALADEGTLRETTLESGLVEMRRVRKRRHAMRAAVVCAPVLMVIVVVFLGRITPWRPNDDAAALVTQTPETISGTTIRVVNDEQLLDLFKGRPVALVGPAGHQRLILLDEVAN